LRVPRIYFPKFAIIVYGILYLMHAAVSGFSSTDTGFLNVLIVPELTQGADRHIQLSTTQSQLLELNFNIHRPHSLTG